MDATTMVGADAAEDASTVEAMTDAAMDGGFVFDGAVPDASVVRCPRHWL